MEVRNMTSYPFITALFSAILSKSKSIEGRFYVCPKLGHEINYDDLGQVIAENTPQLEKKYPLVLMMPPVKRIVQEWSSYSITLFFLRTSYYGEGNTLNPYTNTSTRPITQDWADMEEVADTFVKVVKDLQRQTNFERFRWGYREAVITPISSIGSDRASGVRVDFELMLPYSCDPLSDYEDINQIEIPA